MHDWDSGASMGRGSRAFDKGFAHWKKIACAKCIQHVLGPFCVVPGRNCDVSSSRDQSFAESEADAAVCSRDNNVLAFHILFLTLDDICFACRRHVSCGSKAGPLEGV